MSLPVATVVLHFYFFYIIISCMYSHVYFWSMMSVVVLCFCMTDFSWQVLFAQFSLYKFSLIERRVVKSWLCHIATYCSFEKLAWLAFEAQYIVWWIDSNQPRKKIDLWRHTKEVFHLYKQDFRFKRREIVQHS